MFDYENAPIHILKNGNIHPSRGTIPRRLIVLRRDTSHCNNIFRKKLDYIKIKRDWKINWWNLTVIILHHVSLYQALRHLLQLQRAVNILVTNYQGCLIMTLIPRFTLKHVNNCHLYFSARFKIIFKKVIKFLRLYFHSKH